MTNKEFIEAIAPYCQTYAQKYGFKVASPAIAQACLESAYGTSTKAKHHNYFGLKYRAGRLTVNNGTFVDGSKEQNADGSYVAITDQWYNFDTMEKGVEGYYQFINISNYAKVKEATTALSYLQAIRTAGYATSLDYVNNVYAVVTKYNLTQYDNFSEKNKGGTAMSNSSLIDCTVKSPNHSGARTHVVDRITPHCVVGQLSAEGIGNCFPTGRNASCNYGIGTEGRVCLIVDEVNRSWCSSSNANDQRAITIECASDKTEPYAFNDKVYSKLIDLCVDICKRYDKKKLLWIDNKDKALAYNPASDEMLLTVHRWFAAKSCPGNWMYARMGDLASKVTTRLGGESTTPLNAGSGTNSAETPAAASNTNYPTVPFTVDVLVSDLNIRKSPNGDKTGQVTGKGKFTITQVVNDWGKLKSGAGYIYLKNGESTEYELLTDGEIKELKTTEKENYYNDKDKYIVRRRVIEVKNASYVKIGTTTASTPAQTNTTSSSYVVQVTADALNYRSGPGTNYKINGTIRDQGRYTIVEEKSGWGKLKSGAGWINLTYTKKI